MWYGSSGESEHINRQNLSLCYGSKHMEFFSQTGKQNRELSLDILKSCTVTRAPTAKPTSQCLHLVPRKLEVDNLVTEEQWLSREEKHVLFSNPFLACPLRYKGMTPV